MDLQWTQAQWQEFFDRIGVVSSAYLAAMRSRDELNLDEIIVDEYWDVDGLLAEWVLSGINFFENTDVYGQLYVEIVANGYNWDINLYKDSARTLLVASGTTSGGSNQYVTLSESGASGISGTVLAMVSLGAWGANSDIWLRLRLGLLRQIQNMPSGDTFDSFVEADMNSTLTDAASGVADSIATIESFARNALIPFIADKIKSSETAVTVNEINTDGTITYEYEGVLADLIDAMGDDSVAGTQQVIMTGIPTTTGPTADPDNVGQLELVALLGGAVTPFWYILPLTLTIECVDETIGAEVFEISAKTDRGESLAARNRATIKKTWCSVDIAIKSFTPTRKYTCSGGTECDHFSQWNISGETNINTDNGKLYFSYDAGTKLLELFSHSSRASQYLVASGTWDGVSGSTVTLAEQNSSGLSGTVRVSQVMGADPVTDTAMIVDLNVCKIGDKWYWHTDNTTVGWRPDKRMSSFLDFFGWIFTTEIPATNFGGTIYDKPANRGYSGLPTTPTW